MAANPIMIGFPLKPEVPMSAIAHPPDSIRPDPQALIIPPTLWSNPSFLRLWFAKTIPLPAALVLHATPVQMAARDPACKHWSLLSERN